jgi:hypothetical protein
MLQAFLNPPRRDGSQYRAFKRQVLLDRPVCEDCCSRPARIVAHLVQPSLGGGLMDKGNVKALCVECDREWTRSNPPLRRRPNQGT